MHAHGLWHGEMPLVLASRSAGRRILLEAAGIPVEAIPAEDVDERAAEDAVRERGADAREVALSLAALKAQAVASVRPGRVVLGADQTLDVDGQPLHKPRSRAEASAHLRRMAGRDHRLHAALVLVRGGTTLVQAVETATLRMRALSDSMIAAYLDAAGDAVLASVGAYQLEGLGIHLFERIEGDHFTIVGLPMLSLLSALRREGLVIE